MIGHINMTKFFIAVTDGDATPFFFEKGATQSPMHGLSTVHAAVYHSVDGHSWHETLVEGGTGVNHSDWVLLGVES